VCAFAYDEIVVFSSIGYTNGQEISSYNGTNFSITFNKGNNSNVPKYYTTGESIRCYGGNYFIVTSNSKTIVSVELTFGSGDNSNAISTDISNYSNGVWDG
jgi:Tfp pilus assembly protein PilX